MLFMVADGAKLALGQSDAKQFRRRFVCAPENNNNKGECARVKGNQRGHQGVKRAGRLALHAGIIGKCNSDFNCQQLMAKRGKTRRKL